ncbi:MULTISPECIES: DUF2846 domain-containing protein [Vibrio]|uniref:DUF2846 domain-containing protein n=1 Tax=Vibrio TaxID=662 RepID=UPI001302C400|nr:MULTISPECIES: DUF2846 domain-containing protein [Vibrio]EJL6905488.1 DUF2846 domain-containing protein [Vibrio cholerae]EKF9799924.1 DUF2846 domain-containing protein [Vibrio cholerae]ELL0578722.1 DUF2846 domain-containing protein [Vibrio cholerae]MDV2397910.1 DUF2846 domain-containing protein [Vibrio cholerae]
MKNKLILCSVLLLGLSGCASVPTADSSISNQAKAFEAPTTGNAGIYIYREDTLVGAALKKYVYVDNECIGETAPGVFFYHEVEGNKEHKISTESEFSENDLTIYTEEGRNYFINQFIKMGVFVGGAGLEQVDENKGKAEVLKVDMAQKGNCTVK